jgi:hypothetical protein
MVHEGGWEESMRRELPKRELAFQVRFMIVRGILRYGEREVGEVTGQLVAPIPAWYQPRPPPGQYTFSPPERGRLPDEVIIETMGSVNGNALVEAIQPPPEWPIIPAELVSNLVLDAVIEFASVHADDEYAANEPGDLEDAKSRFEGTWKLVIELPLEGNFRREEAQLNLDRMEFEVDARFAELTET